jgi:hypothetical protein
LNLVFWKQSCDMVGNNVNFGPENHDFDALKK